MRPPHGTALCLLLIAGLFTPSVAQTASVRRVQVLRGRDAVEIEIEASDRLTPQTLVLTGPDRLVVDFPNATPGADLRSQSINRGEVKSVRVGLFQSNPPVTRVVFDLKSPQSYQVFPGGRNVMIKLTAAAQEAEGVDYFPPVARPGLVNASFPAAESSTPPLALETGPATKPSLDVSFHRGLLSIRANRASLSEVLFAVHQRTGAEVAVTAGAEQEPVVADIGPAPAPEVLARLLNGSKFNFLILSSASDPHVLDRVILSPRGDGGVAAMPAMASSSTGDDTDEDVPLPTPTARAAATQPPSAGGEIPPPPPHEVSPGPQQEERPSGDNPPN